MLVEQWRSHWVKVQTEQAFRAQLMAFDCTWLGMRQHKTFWVKLSSWPFCRPGCLIGGGAAGGRLLWRSLFRHAGSDWIAVSVGDTASHFRPRTAVYQQPDALKQQCQRSRYLHDRWSWTVDIHKQKKSTTWISTKKSTTDLNIHRNIHRFFQNAKSTTGHWRASKIQRFSD